MRNHSAQEFSSSRLPVNGKDNASRARVILRAAVGVVDPAVEQDRELEEGGGVAFGEAPSYPTEIFERVRVAAPPSRARRAVESRDGVCLGNYEASTGDSGVHAVIVRL